MPAYFHARSLASVKWLLSALALPHILGEKFSDSEKQTQTCALYVPAYVVCVSVCLSATHFAITNRTALYIEPY